MRVHHFASTHAQTAGLQQVTPLASLVGASSSWPTAPGVGQDQTRMANGPVQTQPIRSDSFLNVKHLASHWPNFKRPPQEWRCGTGWRPALPCWGTEVPKPPLTLEGISRLRAAKLLKLMSHFHRGGGFDRVDINGDSRISLQELKLAAADMKAPGVLRRLAQFLSRESGSGKAVLALLVGKKSDGFDKSDLARVLQTPEGRQQLMAALQTKPIVPASVQTVAPGVETGPGPTPVPVPGISGATGPLAGPGTAH